MQGKKRMWMTDRVPCQLELRFPVDEEDYGPVLILRGKFAGRVGLYDDDDPASARKAVVYIHPKNDEAPFLDPCGLMIEHDYQILCRADLASIESSEARDP
jgi:hypothetical protein